MQLQFWLELLGAITLEFEHYIRAAAYHVMRAVKIPAIVVDVPKSFFPVRQSTWVMA